MNKNNITFPFMVEVVGLLSSFSYSLNTYSCINEPEMKETVKPDQNIIKSSTGDLEDYNNGISAVKTSNEIFENFVSDIVSNAQSMPSDIAAFVNDNFWDLV